MYQGVDMVVGVSVFYFIFRSPEWHERLRQLPEEGLQQLRHHVDVRESKATRFALHLFLGVPAHLIGRAIDRSCVCVQRLDDFIGSYWRMDALGVVVVVDINSFHSLV